MFLSLAHPRDQAGHEMSYLPLVAAPVCERLWVAGSAPKVVLTLLFLRGWWSLGSLLCKQGRACLCAGLVTALLCQPSCACLQHLNGGGCLASAQLECLASTGGLAAFPAFAGRVTQEGRLVQSPFSDGSLCPCLPKQAALLWRD